jgi:phosphoribosylformylglycinamidine synthase
VAHGEGRFVAEDLDAIGSQIAFRYLGDAGEPDSGAAGAGYPANPNGSDGDVAGICDPTGRIIGLMPHPENHVLRRQDPLRGRRPGGLCLPLFEAGVAAVLS